MKVLDLNEPQLQAVEHMEGPLLVLAGAGSGKTRVVTHRITHLLERGVPHYRILAVTFTNKAAGEMKERIEKMVPKAPLICTFHSLGARILRESIEHLGYKKDFVIYDEEDSLRLLKSSLKEKGVNEKEVTPKSMKGLISRQKNDFNEEFNTSKATSEAEKCLPDIYFSYQRKLKEANAVDFDDLLVLPVKLFQTCPEVLHSYQDRWHYVLVDEYQDTNRAQYLFVRCIVERDHNFFVVGDPDQSIYGWRGAHIENILNFEKDWPEAKVVRLEQNYRSTETILKASNELVAHNTSRYKKNLWSSLGKGDLITFFQAHSERDEAEFITNQMRAFHQKKLPYGQMVVFYRTNAQSRPFEDALLSQRIPYAIIGGISFYQRKEIKDLLSFLKMVQTDYDIISFLRTIQLPKRGIGEASLAKISQIAEESKTPIYEMAKRLAYDEVSSLRLPPKQKEGLKEYIQIIDQLRALKEKLPLHDLIVETIRVTHYLEQLKAEPESYEDRKENIDELIGKAAEFGESAETPSLSTFLEELTLKTTLDEESIHADRISLMTIHNGKGLEFDLVFLAGLEEMLFPHINASNTPEGIEEERRLCYVGMTRAKKHLFLSACQNRFLWGGARSMRPSRFLKEIPSCYIKGFDEEDDTPEEAPLENLLCKGDIIFHKDFGVGKILEVGNSSIGVTYKVIFQKDGSMRTLLAKFAKLKKLNET